MLNIIRALLIFLTANCYGNTVDLITLFRDSLTHESQFISQQEELASAMQNKPIAIAELLPSLTSEASWSRIYNHKTTTSNIFSSSGSPDEFRTNYGVSVRQPILDVTKWYGVAKADRETKQANAKFNGQLQDLIIRVATAYFDILKAKDDVKFAKSENTALKRQLTQTKHRFDAGLETMTAVHSAQAAYDSSVATMLAAQNKLDNAMTFLGIFTDQTYVKTKELKEQLPFHKPALDKQELLKVTLRNNHSMQEQIYKAEAAKKELSISRAAHLPTIDADASYQDSRNSISRPNTFADSKATKNIYSTINITARLPLFQGGQVLAQSRAAAHKYMAAKAQQDYIRKNLENQVTQTYNKITSKISQIKALEQAVKSASSSLVSTQKSYKQGANTIFDVLSAQKDVSRAKQNLASNIYDYIIETLKLKQLTGTLSEQDLIELNNHLTN